MKEVLTVAYCFPCYGLWKMSLASWQVTNHKLPQQCRLWTTQHWAVKTNFTCLVLVAKPISLCCVKKVTFQWLPVGILGVCVFCLGHVWMWGCVFRRGMDARSAGRALGYGVLIAGCVTAAFWCCALGLFFSVFALSLCVCMSLSLVIHFFFSISHICSSPHLCFSDTPPQPWQINLCTTTCYNCFNHVSITLAN